MGIALCSYDNSGHRVSFPGWHSNQTNIARTNNVIKRIASEFGPQNDVVSAIGPMNESVPDLRLYPRVLCLTLNDRPAGYDGTAVLNAVRQYWLDSYGNIREKSANTLEMIHDAFQPLSYWNGWQRPPQYQGVALDTHIYQIFTLDVSLLILCFKSASMTWLDLLGHSTIAIATHSHYVQPG